MTFGELAARFIADASPKPFHLDRLKVLLPYWSETPLGAHYKGTRTGVPGISAQGEKETF